MPTGKPSMGITMSLCAAGTMPSLTSPLTTALVQQVLKQRDRPSLITYLNYCCEAGQAALVQQLCRLRPDFGLRVTGGQVVEFFQVGDTIRIFRNGQFYNKLAQIIAVEGGFATVRGDGWVVDLQFFCMTAYPLYSNPKSFLLN